MHNFPVDPTPDTLSFFVVYMSHHIEPRSVDAYLSGISSELESWFPHVRAARRSALVARTLRGCKRMFSKPVNRKHALSREDLVFALESVGSHPSYDDILFLTLLITGFHALLRLGELVWPDNHDLQSYRKIIMRASVLVSHDQYEFTLPSHKADPFFEGNRIIVRASRDPPNPLPLFQRYLTARDALFRFNPELWLRESGAIPTRSWFINRLRTLFPPNIAGHSMRAGGATSLAAAGVPPATIQAMGRCLLAIVRKIRALWASAGRSVRPITNAHALLTPEPT
ncbi:hypothetical protein FKP32DRAFT_1611990 [Trametes sanguinea]|nr:hypothetical protein FKP32DRAFT_1611990 [Trametes sanguinea]